MRYAYHDAAFSSHYDSTIFNFQTARLGQYNPTTNCSLFFWTSVFIFQNMQFIRGIPAELDEAARIDGCTYYGIFLRIILPLIKPSIVTTAIFSFMWRWDDFFRLCFI